MDASACPTHSAQVIASEGAAKRLADATAAVAQMPLSAMQPGVRISELQAKGCDIYRREGVPDPAAAVIF